MFEMEEGKAELLVFKIGKENGPSLKSIIDCFRKTYVNQSMAS